MKKTKYNVINIAALTLLPIFGVFGTIWHVMKYGVVWQEPILLIIFWIITGLGITVGYHRLFSHRSFTAHPILDWILAIFGAAALENSALQWCSNHRSHHKHLDTDKDPYSITKGFFHAHIGWIFENKPFPIDKVDDLQKKPALIFQHKYYYLLFAMFSIGLPVSLGLLWGRPLGALFWAVLLRITLVHHFTYFINSLCHYIGSKPYDAKCTSRDSWYVAFLTFGEGFHNYHHKFQWDYRNGIRWFHFDPSKWVIWFFSKVGLAKKLKKASYIQIMKAKSKNTWNQIQSNLDTMPKQISNSYNNKLYNIKERIQSIEKSWIMLDKEMIPNIIGQKIPTKTIKLIQEKRKQLQTEYISHLRSLSLILITLQNNPY